MLLTEFFGQQLKACKGLYNYSAGNSLTRTSRNSIQLQLQTLPLLEFYSRENGREVTSWQSCLWAASNKTRVSTLKLLSLNLRNPLTRWKKKVRKTARRTRLPGSNLLQKQQGRRGIRSQNPIANLTSAKGQGQLYTIVVATLKNLSQWDGM